MFLTHQGLIQGMWKSRESVLQGPFVLLWNNWGFHHCCRTTEWSSADVLLHSCSARDLQLRGAPGASGWGDQKETLSFGDGLENGVLASWMLTAPHLSLLCPLYVMVLWLYAYLFCMRKFETEKNTVTHFLCIHQTDFVPDSTSISRCWLF